MSSKILVTGSSGTIGTRLCEKFLDEKIDFIGLDWKPNKWNKKINDLTVRQDIREKSFSNKLPSNIDTVIHLAANSRVHDLINDPLLALDNFITLTNILEYSRQNNINRFIFSSSREVYGCLPNGKAREVAIDLDLCESPYSASKLGGEALIQSYCNCYNLDFLILRFSNVYGMYDVSDRVIPRFIEQCKSKEDLKVFGQDKILDFVYIDDVINAISLGFQKFDAVKNDVFNISFGEGTSLIDLAKTIKAKMESEINIKVENNRAGEVMEFIGDISKANLKLGYKPKVAIEEGIAKAILWYSKILN